MILSVSQSEFDNHYPSNNLVSFFKMHPFIFPKDYSLSDCFEWVSSFYNGSSKRTAVVVSCPVIKTAKIASDSAQFDEVLALAMDLQFFPREAVNIYTDSQYVAKIV